MKILVVDDHAYNRELLGFMLEDHGCVPVYAENGMLALEQVLSDTSIDLVLMDVMMPVMDGLEATTAIKEQCQDRFLPVLFVTALDDEKNITACLNAGGDDFVPKPVNENILVAKVKAHERSKALYDQVKNSNEELTYHRKLMDREHSIVEHIFENGSKRQQTSCDNLSVYTSPMSMFNGDLVLSAPSPSGGLYLLLGDFTGHGLAASIGSLPVGEVFYQQVQHQASVSKIATEINHRLKILLPQNMFFCAAIAELDATGEQMTLWLGGMNDILQLKADGRLLHLESRHMPLGILSDEEFDDSPDIYTLEAQDKLYIYTDGITEAVDSEGNEFGQQRLEQIVRSSEERSLQTIVDAVNAFSESDEQNDDVSIALLNAGPLVHRDKLSNEPVDIGADYHTIDSIPWSLDLSLFDKDLQRTNIVDQLMSFVSSISGMEAHQDKIFTIVSELYNNALEHGILGLDSQLKADADGFEKYYQLRQQRLQELSEQRINVSFKFVRADPNQLHITINDSGRGFDVEAVCRRINEGEQSHGRGMLLLEQLCSHLEYRDGGRTAFARYDLSLH
ncbi:ATP-binding SpoIIE family protein phosphatase [Agaribacterium haliotis]|uniref:ATP-binding SpoIIE family protein phosphatase n=1 Tax=Agaribacterium haliotis TaxID=2013869 RepID=UPI000BB53928|nr:fused response regulator/phosphatase [Agaribacterium haliotis]